MKRLLLLLPLLVLGGCKYQSMAEARLACEDWSIDGIVVVQECKGARKWEKADNCITKDERDKRIAELRKANTTNGMVDLRAVKEQQKSIPRAFSYSTISPRSCRLERDTNQVMGLERGKGIVRRFRY